MPTDPERLRSLVVTAAVLTSLSGFAVAVRLAFRILIILKAGWDDLTIFLAVVFTFGYLGEIIIGGANGMGVPAASLTLDNMIIFLKNVVAIEITYYVIVGLVKISILCVYLRFALKRPLQYACYATIVFEVIFTIVCVILMVAQCVPLSKAWDLTGTKAGKCIDTTAVFYTTSAINIVTDVWILVLPMRTLISVKRPVREKVALVGIFGAGIFSTIVSMIRLYSIHIYTLSSDPFHDAIPINFWSMIEINTAILCASIPALKPLLSPLRLRKAIYDRRHGHDLETGPDSVEPAIFRNEPGGETKPASDRPELNPVQIASEGTRTPATRKSERGYNLASPASAVLKQEVSRTVPYMI